MAGHNLRVAFESRWITKDKGTQIIFSRSFIVLVVQQNFCFTHKQQEHPVGCSCCLCVVAVPIFGRFQMVRAVILRF